jgi:hypothetical protein
MNKWKYRQVRMRTRAPWIQMHRRFPSVSGRFEVVHVLRMQANGDARAGVGWIDGLDGQSEVFCFCELLDHGGIGDFQPACMDREVRRETGHRR